MKCTHKLFTIAALLVFCMAHSQSKEGKSVAIVKIKRAYQQINSYKSYKTVVIDNAETFLGHSPDNGGSLTGYYKNDSLKKIVEWVGLSYKAMQNEYYFDSDQLIFVYANESNYHLIDSTQKFDYDKLDPVFTGRYYFNRGKLIDTILTDPTHAASKEQDASSFVASAKRYAKLLKAKRK